MGNRRRRSSRVTSPAFARSAGAARRRRAGPRAARRCAAAGFPGLGADGPDERRMSLDDDGLTGLHANFAIRRQLEGIVQVHAAGILRAARIVADDLLQHRLRHRDPGDLRGSSTKRRCPAASSTPLAVTSLPLSRRTDRTTRSTGRRDCFTASRSTADLGDAAVAEDGDGRLGDPGRHLIAQLVAEVGPPRSRGWASACRRSWRR